jgi:hypothetical protein
VGDETGELIQGLRVERATWLAQAFPEETKGRSTIMPIFFPQLTQMTNTPARRHAFFCYMSQKWNEDLGLFWLLVQQFQTDRKKKQALLLKDWFLDGNIPAECDDDDLRLSRLNIAASVRNPASTAAGRFRSVLTFTQKIDAAGGLMGAIVMKITGESTPPADLFDKALNGIWQPLQNPAIDLENFNPDGSYKFRGDANKMQILSALLTAAGFDPDSAGIY